MEEWKEYKLEEVGKITTGKTPKTAIKEYFDGDICFVTPADINTPDKYVHKTDRYLTNEGLNSILSNSIDKGSICVSCIGNIGYTGIVKMKCASNQQINSITVNQEFDRDFIYYSIKNLWPFFKNYEGQSTTLSILNKGQFSKITVKCPSFETQKHIAAILSSLDDKIEVNRRINDNLKQQAHEMFKTWFVDFEPFKDGDFVESELGMIPKGWRVEPLTCLIKFQEGPGIRNWQYVQENGTKFINIRCIKDGDIYTETANMISNEEANGKYAHFMLEVGDIVMSCSGTLGRYAIVREDHLPLCLNTSVIRFKPVLPNNYSYVLGFLTSSYFLNKQIEMACGSVQANFGPTHLKQMKILVPPQTIITQYEEKCISLITLMQKKKYENKHLATLRDTLLPKLMSGELKVNEVKI